MDFFERFEEARYEFTYGDEKNPELPVVQVGLVATFFLDQSWRRRKEMIRLMDLYLERFGNYVKWLTFGRKPKERKYSQNNVDKLKRYFLEEDSFNAVEFDIGSIDIDHSGEYSFALLSIADWFEEVHKDMSYVRYHLPIEVLKGDGREQFEALLKTACELLQPLHGQAGLAVQQCYEQEEYQHIEYEIAQQFQGLDVGHPVIGSSEVRTGFKTVNWYTLLSDELLDKLGGQDSLCRQFDDERIAVLPYAGGAMIRAGDWPELGWVERDPKPELYVSANRVLRPVRAKEVGLAYGSIAGEVRFNARTADLWLRRFDEPETVNGESSSPLPKDRLRCEAGKPCPKSGIWWTPAMTGSHRHVTEGETMPDFPGAAYGATIWYQEGD